MEICFYVFYADEQIDQNHTTDSSTRKENRKLEGARESAYLRQCRSFTGVRHRSCPVIVYTDTQTDTRTERLIS